MAICAVARDQSEDIREWVEYHRWLGAGKIYLYDNHSKPPMSSSLLDFIKSGFVEYQYFSGLNMTVNNYTGSNQAQAYIGCLQRHRHRHRWLAFIDVDEFFVLHGGEEGGIAAFMQPYEPYSGLGVHWMIFGNSGHKERPAGGVLANYVYCVPPDAPINRHIKTITNTKYLVDIGPDPHTFIHTPGCPPVVNQDSKPLSGAVIHSQLPVHSKIALYHYLLKSDADYSSKVKRGSGDGGRKNSAFQKAVNQQATSICSFGIRLGLVCCSNSVIDQHGNHNTNLRSRRQRQL
jgi:hypothetical protein